MKRWIVISPEYGEVIPILDDGSGPMEYGCDVVEIEAETRRDALVLGVMLMRRHPSQHHWLSRWCDGNPYAGMTVNPLPDPCVAHKWVTEPTEAGGFTYCVTCGDEAPEDAA